MNTEMRNTWNTDTKGMFEQNSNVHKYHLPEDLQNNPEEEQIIFV